ncbi:MAG: hypothetical protein ACKVQK_22570 [Burkholderiales bacterium]
MRTNLTLALLIAISSSIANAQAPNPNAIAFNATVNSMDAATISLTSEDGGAVDTFRLAPNLLVLQNKSATLADIKPNDFVASAAVRKADGKLHSTELRIFPDALRGLGEGQRPMNDPQNQTMTNATVTGTAIVGGSNNIKVKYQGGESELILNPGVPVTAILPVDRSLVKAGAKVRVQGAKNADGVLINRITLR